MSPEEKRFHAAVKRAKKMIAELATGVHDVGEPYRAAFNKTVAAIGKAQSLARWVEPEAREEAFSLTVGPADEAARAARMARNEEERAGYTRKKQEAWNQLTQYEKDLRLMSGSRRTITAADVFRGAKR